jgi:ubiquinone/menaquinone biosynthesis C-methylase UbiE
MRVLLCAWLLPWVARVVGGAEQDSEATSAYFAEYGSITDHISMLVDAKRMSAYHDAIMNRAEEDFNGKVVMDIGCGTGVLSGWAAMEVGLGEPGEGTTAQVDRLRAQIYLSRCGAFRLAP